MLPSRSTNYQLFTIEKMLFMFIYDINIRNYLLWRQSLKAICLNYYDVMKKVSFTFWMLINILQTSLFILNISIYMFLENFPQNKKVQVLTFHWLILKIRSLIPSPEGEIPFCGTIDSKITRRSRETFAPILPSWEALLVGPKDNCHFCITLQSCFLPDSATAELDETAGSEVTTALFCLCEPNIQSHY